MDEDSDDEDVDAEGPRARDDDDDDDDDDGRDDSSAQTPMTQSPTAAPHALARRPAGLRGDGAGRVP